MNRLDNSRLADPNEFSGVAYMKLIPNTLAGGNGFGIGAHFKRENLAVADSGRQMRRPPGRLCRDITTLLENPTLLQDPDSPKLLA